MKMLNVKNSSTNYSERHKAQREEYVFILPRAWTHIKHKY